MSKRRRSEPSSTMRHIVWGVFIVILAALILAGLWYGTRLPFFTLSTITVEGGETISHDDVRMRVERELGGAYLLIIPHTFSYVYPEKQILETLNEIPRIYNVSLTREGRKTLVVRFDEYIPYALWCSEEERTALCYFLTEDGYAFAEAPVLSGGALVRHTVEGKSEVTAGMVFETSFFKKIHAFVARLEGDLSLRVTDVFHTKDGDVRLRVNGGGTLLISETQDFDSMFNNLASIIKSKEFDHLEPGNFNYIDLRFGNKIFVNEELASAESIMATTSELENSASSTTE